MKILVPSRREALNKEGALFEAPNSVVGVVFFRGEKEILSQEGYNPRALSSAGIGVTETLDCCE
jgi:hypothetical protein